jgi:hypothetical protein
MDNSAVSAMDAVEAEERAMKFHLLKVRVTVQIASVYCRIT